MARSPDSLVPSAAGQPAVGKRDDKAACRQDGEANPRAATQVNAAASSTPPASRPIQLDLFPGRAGPLTTKPATDASATSDARARRDGVRGGGTRREHTRATGETLSGPAEEVLGPPPRGREAHKGSPRKRRPDAGQGVGGGRSTDEPRDNRGEGRAAASTERTKRGKTAGLHPKGDASPRPKSAQRMDKVRKLQRTLYRVAKQQPERRFTLLYDKVQRPDVLQEAWHRVRSNGGAAGVDKQTIAEVREYGEQRFLGEIAEELRSGRYRASAVRRVHIPKPGQPGRTRPLGIPTVKDRVVQMAVKLVIEPLFEADFRPCSFGFRPKRTPRMALAAIVSSLNEGYSHVIDIDLRSYFDTIDHSLLLQMVERRVGDVRVLRLLRAWLKAGVMEEGKITHPVRGSPQGGVISPLLSNIYLHEVDRRFSGMGGPTGGVRMIRYADDMVLLARSRADADRTWIRFQELVKGLRLSINEEKSRLTSDREGFAFLGFEFRRVRGRLLLWPRKKAVLHLGARVRETVRSYRSSSRLDEVVRGLNLVLRGWCTYFRVGNSNRVFHRVDWMVRNELQLWLRRKHQCDWRRAQKRWGYRFLHEDCGLYRMVGKVSHLPGLRTPPEEGGRRAVCGKTARTVR
jgi:RNA-directed DNA polymerase